MLQNNTPAQPGLGDQCLATDSYIGRTVNQSSRACLKHSDGDLFFFFYCIINFESINFPLNEIYHTLRICISLFIVMNEEIYPMLLTPTTNIYPQRWPEIRWYSEKVI